MVVKMETLPAELSVSSASSDNFDSDSSYSSCDSQGNSEGRAKTHSLTPTRAAIAAPQPAQGTSSNVNERRNKRVDSARSHQSEQPDVQRQKMTTPYGHVLTKNGYIMVSHTV